MLLQDFFISYYADEELKGMWISHSVASFAHWKIYLSIGVPNAIMQCLEWWAFEIFAIFCGIIGTEYLAAQVNIIQIVSFIFFFSLGISFAVSSFVGNNLGAGKIELAKKYGIAGVVFNVLVTIILLIILLLFAEEISMIFTKEHDVVEIMISTLTIIAFYSFWDTLHGVLAGVIRGIG